MEMTSKKKQGVVFSLDAAIAVTVIIIILINSAYYFSTSSKESLSQLQPVRIGSDVVAILDFLDVLEQIVITDPIVETSVGGNLFVATSLNLSTYLPANYDMKILISDLTESVINKSRIVDSNAVGCPVNPTTPLCSLNPGEFATVATLPIETAGKYNLILKTNRNDLNLDPTLQQNIRADVNGGSSYITFPYFELDTQNNQRVYLFYNLPFNEGINEVTFTNTDPDKTIELHWFRVIGDDAYALTNDKTLPKDRFVGSGERYIAVANGDDFLGFHIVRYWIWLQATTST